MSIVQEEIKEEFNDGETEWEAKLNDMDEDGMSEALNSNYDVIENSREDSPYYPACVNALEHYKQRVGDDAAELDIIASCKSKQMLAIDIIIYINN